MFVYAILYGFFAMNEEIEKGILIYDFWEKLVHFLSDEADLNCTRDCLLINNAIFKVPGASV